MNAANDNAAPQTRIHLLDPTSAAAIRAENDRYMARPRPLFAVYDHDGFGFDVRHKGGHITLLSESDADELAGLLRIATWAVEVQHLWVLTFRAMA